MTNKSKVLSEVPEAPAYEVENLEENDKLAAIRILDGEYAGVVYHYGIVTIGEEYDDGSVPMNFEYNIVEGGSYEHDPDFEAVVASILQKIVSDVVDETVE